MFCALLLALAARADPANESIVPKHWLVIEAVDKSGRRPLRPDAVFRKHLLERDAPPPRKDELLRGENEKDCAWKELDAKDDGSVEGEVGCAYTAIESDAERVWMAKLSGASRLFVNGTGFVGDAYAYGFGGVPIALRKGRNDLYVTGVRGSFRLELWAPPKEVFLASWDATFPDTTAAELDAQREAAVVVVNATNREQEFGLNEGDGKQTFGGSRRITLPALSLEKIPISCWVHEEPARLGEKLSFPVYLHFGQAIEPTDRQLFDISVRPAGAARRITFRSRDDDSLQECAVRFATEKQKAVVLTLHGAGVDCMGQINAYSPKPEFTLIAPTNRRPYGFDWQDWGRANAYEALYAVIGEVPRALYLTGHSMGGHGTWHLAANDPDRFAAIASSAGWASFDSYGGRPKGAHGELWHAADASSDTLSLLANLTQLPTFILHGTQDDNVPVSEAQAMEKALTTAGHPPKVHYQEGAGHWWDGDHAVGADCVDWPEIFELFRDTKPRTIGSELDFTSVDPSVDSTCGWLSILELKTYGKPAHVKSHLREDHALVIETENVRYLRLRAAPLAEKPIDRKLVVDGTAIPLPPGKLDLLYEKDRWVELPPDAEDAPVEDEGALDAQRIHERAGWKAKTPDRSGPFKRAFTRSFVLVYGTEGTPAENRELFERARSDAQTWWYRGNGRARLLTDFEYLAQGAHSPSGVEGNVILYGNADTNVAWKERLGARCPIQVHRGALRVGDKEWKGDDLCALFVFPPTLDEPKMPELFGVVGDTGVKGTRLGYDLAYFISGVGYPDYTVFDSKVLEQGDASVLAAGWFDATWQLPAK